MSEGFFERWSRRKQQVREGEVPEEAVVPVEAAPVVEAARPHPSLPPEGKEKYLLRRRWRTRKR